MFNWLKHHVPTHKTRFEDATAQNIAALLSKCPACSMAFSTEHKYALMDSVPLTPEYAKDTANLIEAIESGNWRNAKTRRQFNTLQDCLEVFIVSCTASKATILVALKNPFELYENHSLLLTRNLESSEADFIETSLKPEDWKCFH